MNHRDHQPQDSGELALRIAKRIEERVEALEVSFETMRAKIEGSMAPKARITKARLALIGSIVPVVVAIITWVASVQVEKIKAENKGQINEAVRQKVDDSDRKLEGYIERASDEAAKRAVKERDRQVDRITGRTNP